VADDIVIAGLACDVAGAVLLARALAFETPGEYAEGWRHGSTWGAVGGLNAHADFARARDAVEARVGTILLVTGFLGQLIGAVVSHESDRAAVAGYVVVGLLLLAAVLSLRPLRRQREREVFVALMRATDTAKRRYDLYTTYLAAFTQRGQTEADLELWIADTQRVLGRHPWHGELTPEETHSS
jgi:hypothetical protein